MNLQGHYNNQSKILPFLNSILWVHKCGFNLSRMLQKLDSSIFREKPRPMKEKFEDCNDAITHSLFPEICPQQRNAATF